MARKKSTPAPTEDQFPVGTEVWITVTVPAYDAEKSVRRTGAAAQSVDATLREQLWLLAPRGLPQHHRPDFGPTGGPLVYRFLSRYQGAAKEASWQQGKVTEGIHPDATVAYEQAA